jgi:hypothetical protein
MKTYSKITIGAAAIAFASLMIVSKRKANAENRKTEIANEGYEAAADSIKPSKKLRKMHLGPVLPHHNFS